MNGNLHYGVERIIEEELCRLIFLKIDVYDIVWKLFIISFIKINVLNIFY